MHTFQVDFESPVFAALSISCNNPEDNFHLLDKNYKVFEFIVYAHG